MKNILWISNIITFVLLLFMILYYQVPQKVYAKLFKTNSIPPVIKIQKDSTGVACAYGLEAYDFHYKKESDSATIIMVGDSHIRNGDWVSLLNRQDIINRGISGDNSTCICERLKYLKGKNAKIWFINGGMNDLPWNSPAVVFENYKRIIEFVKEEGAIPVINLLLYSSPWAGYNYPTRSDYKKINSMVEELNSMLISYAKSNNIDYIDLNPILADKNKIFKDEYTTDGIHLTNDAYQKWAILIQKILVQKNI